MTPRNHAAALTWRLATARDLVEIHRIGNAIHADLPESPEVFEEKLRLFPQGCFVLTEHARIVGYSFCHPWRLRSIPPLNQLLIRLPAPPDAMLIHDVAVLPEARGRGSTAVLVGLIETLAKRLGISDLALVSVYNTRAFWARFGFEEIADSKLADKLASYGATARYMVRGLR
jgi:ribosomal protein S18 acetylase RimI-like enzyme